MIIGEVKEIRVHEQTCVNCKSKIINDYLFVYFQDAPPVNGICYKKLFSLCKECCETLEEAKEYFNENNF